MSQLLVATTNRHKASEIRAMLPSSWEVLDLRDLGIPHTPPDETGATFLANAIIKAVAASHLTNALVLADDSGLEVDALGGAPGVRSARYAGDKADDAANRARLLRELVRVRPHDRSDQALPSARFRCAMALAKSGHLLATVEGTVEGTIIDVERGSNGFGYDSLFVPRGFAQTFAELSAQDKNRISHRGQALSKIVHALTNSECETRNAEAN
jgi:XTP/dITP diphosphohydrolase